MKKPDSVRGQLQECREASEWLEAAHANLLRILDGLDVAVYIADLETYEILYMNRYLRERFGEVTGRPCWQVLQADQTGPCPFCTNDKIVDADGAFQGTYLWEFQNTLNHRWYEVRDKAITWCDGRAARLEVAADITERKQTEKLLVEAKMLLDQMFDSPHLLLALLDTDLNFIRVSRGYADKCRKPREYFTGRNHFALYPHPENERIFRTVLQTGQPFSTSEKEFIYPDQPERGTTYWNWSLYPLFNLHGQIEGLLLDLADITEKKHLEEQIAQLQKLEAIGTLAGGIAHDFNNILSAIIGYNELAILHLTPESKAQELLEAVRLAGRRAKELVDQILTFSRRSHPALRPIQISTIVKEVLKLLRATIPASIAIRQDIHGGRARIMADPTQVHQVLMNLCTNAYQAMAARGGTLYVGLHEEEVSAAKAATVPDLQPGRHLRLTVADTGHGMNEAVRKKLFDPFFTTKKKGEGTGLGLSVVLGIVQNSGGAIAVRSIEGEGSAFEVYLPVVESEEGLQEERLLYRPLKRGWERILFVDDEQALANLGRRMLQYLGYQVSAHTSGEEAWKDFSSRPHWYDLAVTDQQMPSQTGLQLAGKLRRLRPDLPVILCTGYAEQVAEAAAREAGVAAILAKPFELAKLADQVRAVLDGIGPEKTSPES